MTMAKQTEESLQKFLRKLKERTELAQAIDKHVDNCEKLKVSSLNRRQRRALLIDLWQLRIRLTIIRCRWVLWTIQEWMQTRLE